ncbi:MAG: aminodeoxychorismate/anthranilate synthase component II [Verrucomicrobiota bacterium]|nr:aminodeoxychorismate/anthranilate synthase component II [Verrucomicrobiota bacterium]
MILIIDNYDSFTYNLAQYFGELGCDVVVRRNDEITVEEIGVMGPERICISPGPGRPEDAHLSNAILQTVARNIPTLGVCLGHQCIASVFGAEVVRADRLMHGRTSRIEHNGAGVFRELPNPFTATRYHSLIVRRDSVPACLEITAATPESEIMGLRHRKFPIHGVQFHPESVLTENGKTLLANFLAT